jgi:hypothetical protein
MNILVEYNDDFTAFYDASTEEQWAKSALHILKERDDMGTYHEPQEPQKPEEPDPEVLAKLPASLRSQYERPTTTYRRDLKRYRLDKEWYDNMRACVDGLDLSIVERRNKAGVVLWRAPRAWLLLDQRCDYEYERVEVERVIAPDPAATS